MPRQEGVLHRAHCLPAVDRAGRAGALTNACGSGDEVDQPEEQEGSAQAAGSEDDGSGDQREEEEHRHLLHHLEQQVGARPVQPIVALPACAHSVTVPHIQRRWMEQQLH